MAPTPLAPAPTPAPAPAPTRKASVYTPARTCQTANFCKTNCGISGTVTQNSVSWGICCADCTKADTIQQVNGVCSNSCASSGPEPAATPAPTQKNIAGKNIRVAFLRFFRLVFQPIRIEPTALLARVEICNGLSSITRFGV